MRLGAEFVDLERDDASVRALIRPSGDGAPETVSARYLLGCDGASSPVREIAALPLKDLDCDEPWLVCDWILAPGRFDVDGRPPRDGAVEDGLRSATAAASARLGAAARAK